jgi:hypothetical protein
MKPEFKEVQRFTQWWLWLILLGIGIIPILGIYKQIILGEPFGDQPMSDVGLIIFAIFIFALIAFFRIMQLKTEVDEKGIRMNFFPLVKKEVLWTDLKSAEVVNYGFVGYGIRMGTKHGTVYNTKGNKGLAIELQNGQKFVIGTQKESELEKVIEKAKGQF